MILKINIDTIIPDIDIWESIGFVFIDNESIILPFEWQVLSKGKDYIIVDDFGNKRGFIKEAAMGAILKLNSRYKVCSKHVDEKGLITEIWFGNEEEKLFVAGSVEMSFNDKWEDKLKKYEEKYRLRMLAEAFGNDSYPDWHNPLMYWEKEKEKKLILDK